LRTSIRRASGLPLSKNGTLDAGHVRNALARFNQTHFESESAKQKALAKIHAAAKKLGIKVGTEQTREGYVGDRAAPLESSGPLVAIHAEARQ
jgi:hypothetical protein